MWAILDTSNFSLHAQLLQSYPTLWPQGLQPARLLSPWNSSDKNSGVGCHALLQGIFLTQGSNLSLLHYRWTLYCWTTAEALKKEFLKIFSEYFLLFYYSLLFKTYFATSWKIFRWINLKDIYISIDSGFVSYHLCHCCLKIKVSYKCKS